MDSQDEDRRMIDLPAITAAARDLADEHRRAHETYPCEFVYDERCIRDDELRFVGSLSQQNLMRWFVLAWRDVPKLANAVGPLVEEAERLRSLLAECIGPVTAATPNHDGWGGTERPHRNVDLLNRIDAALKGAGKEQP